MCVILLGRGRAVSYTHLGHSNAPGQNRAGIPCAGRGGPPLNREQRRKATREFIKKGYTTQQAQAATALLAGRLSRKYLKARCV